jgi:hypothetical protein
MVQYLAPLRWISAHPDLIRGAAAPEQERLPVLDVATLCSVATLRFLAGTAKPQFFWLAAALLMILPPGFYNVQHIQ